MPLVWTRLIEISSSIHCFAHDRRPGGPTRRLSSVYVACLIVRHLKDSVVSQSEVFLSLMLGFSQPVDEAEVPEDIVSEFNFGKPWPISGLVR